MQMLAAGSRSHPCTSQGVCRATAGFTLLELLVVLAIVAMASVGVGLALRDSSQVQLEREAERLGALLESARVRSRVSGVPVRWRVGPDGFKFQGLGAPALPAHWLDPDTGVADITGGPDNASLLLGPEPIIAAQQLVLVSRQQPARRVRLATDGVRPFAVQPEPAQDAR